jgi:hypothetical protein
LGVNTNLYVFTQFHKEAFWVGAIPYAFSDYKCREKYFGGADMLTAPPTPLSLGCRLYA